MLRAEWLWSNNGGQDEVIALLEEAIKIDPGCARAYARAAQVLAYGRFEKPPDSDEAARKAVRYAERAVSLGVSDARVQALSATAFLLCGQHDLADAHSAKAIALNRNDAEAVYRRGCVLAYHGDPQGGLALLRRAVALDPLMPSGYEEIMFDAFYMSREYETAIQTFKRWANPPLHMIAAASLCYAQLGRNEEARDAVAEFNQRRPASFDIAAFVRVHLGMCRRAEDREHWLQGYKKAGLLPCPR